MTSRARDSRNVAEITEGAMPPQLDLPHLIVSAWQTNHRATTFLIRNLPQELWARRVPAAPRRTVGMIAGHMHNARCMWIKWLGSTYRVAVPRSVDRHRVRPQQLLAALDGSGRGISRLLERSLRHDGLLPAKLPYRNVPQDAVHFAAYLIAHEGHHRGQLCLLARQLGHRLPSRVTGGLWQWARLAKEVET